MWMILHFCCICADGDGGRFLFFGFFFWVEFGFTPPPSRRRYGPRPPTILFPLEFPDWEVVGVVIGGGRNMGCGC